MMHLIPVGCIHECELRMLTPDSRQSLQLSGALLPILDHTPSEKASIFPDNNSPLFCI